MISVEVRPVMRAKMPGRPAEDNTATVNCIVSVLTTRLKSKARTSATHQRAQPSRTSSVYRGRNAANNEDFKPTGRGGPNAFYGFGFPGDECAVQA